MPGKQKSGGSKKHGRNKIKCQRYRQEGRREKNRARRQVRNRKREARLAELKRLRRVALRRF